MAHLSREQGRSFTPRQLAGTGDLVRPRLVTILVNHSVVILSTSLAFQLINQALRSPSVSASLRRIRAFKTIISCIAVLPMLSACYGGGEEAPPSTGTSEWTLALKTGDVRDSSSTSVLQEVYRTLNAGLEAETEAKGAVLWNGGAREITWDPTHDSVYIDPLDKGAVHPLLNGNFRYKTAEPPEARALAVLGNDPVSGSRFAAFGANPMAIRGDAGMDRVVENTISWLTKRRDLGGVRVVMAHLPNSGYFKHESAARAWLKTRLRGVIINGHDANTATGGACDGAALANCLVNADVLVIGAQDVYVPGVSGSSNQEVVAAVQAAQMRGVPILFLSHGSSTTELGTHLLEALRLRATTNYWAQEGLKRLDPSTQKLTGFKADTLNLLKRIEHGQFSTDWSGCSEKNGAVSCRGDALLEQEFVRPATAIRSHLRGLDERGIGIFDTPAYKLEKHLVLLGDAYRKAVRYPMDRDADRKRFFEAYFSDMSSFISREHAGAAQNQGSFSQAIAASVQAVDQTVTVAPRHWQVNDHMTGLYAIPGRVVRLVRTDNSETEVSVGVNMVRDSTRVFNPSGYDRPTMLASPRVPLKRGQAVNLTSPFGGPVYLFVKAGAASPAVQVDVSGATVHPMLRNMGDPAEVARFREQLASTSLNWAGIATEFLMVHSTVKHMRKTLSDHNGDVTLLADRLWTYMIKDTYELAGFRSTTGDFELPASVMDFCLTASWDCAGPQHKRDVIQHVVVDVVAKCGSGCSGNPYDQDWPLTPLGWGETHEIAHGLQRTRLNIYADRSTEVSNNIFPVHKMLAFNKRERPAKPFAEHAGKTQASFDILKASLQPTVSKSHVYDTIWSDPGYAANYQLRLTFYRQLVEFARHYNARFRDGWELFTLMYLLERNFSSSEPTWSAQKDLLGFGTYAVYPRLINGNDFMLIATSRIIGRDMRPVWDLWGISYSADAASQVDSFGYGASAPYLFPMRHVTAFGNSVGSPIQMTGDSVYPVGFD